jgi:MYXO-CTERM domain-containing protein
MKRTLHHRSAHLKKTNEERMRIHSLFTLGVICSFGLLAAPIRTRPDLVRVDVVEATSGLTTFGFAPNSSELTTELIPSYSVGNRDFEGLANEPYDIFYSDAAGNFDLNGEYLTIRGTYTGNSNGFNIASVVLILSGIIESEAASVVTAFTPGATGYVAGSELLAVDGLSNTSTSLGRTPNATEVMSLTVGFNNSASAVPEPSTWILGASGVALGLLGRRRRSQS